MISLILVALLGHPSCHVRSAAELSLERLAAPSWPYLVAGAQSADPERAMRSQRLLDALLWDCTLPYLDALPDAMVDRYQVIGRYVQAAIAAGIANVHINTELRIAYHDALEAELKAEPQETTPYKILGPSFDATKALVKKKLELFGSYIDYDYQIPHAYKLHR